MGIGRRSVVRIEAEPGEGELGHVAAPDRNEAGGAQPRDDGRVALGRLRLPQRNRAGGGHLARDIEQILDRDRDAGKRRRRRAPRTQPIMIIGGCDRVLGMDLEKGAAAFARGIGDARETLLDDGAALAATREGSGKLCERLHR